MTFKPGESGNPQGRPVGAKNKLPSESDLKKSTRVSDAAIKKQGKRYGPEAVNNIVQFMRDAKDRVDSLKKEEIELRDEIALEIDKNTKSSLKMVLNTIRSSISKEEEKYYKASMKIIDVSHGLVMHDDKMKKKVSKDLPPLEDEEEETPVLSLVALTPNQAE